MHIQSKKILDYHAIINYRIIFKKILTFRQCIKILTQINFLLFVFECVCLSLKNIMVLGRTSQNWSICLLDWSQLFLLSWYQCCLLERYAQIPCAGTFPLPKKMKGVWAHASLVGFHYCELWLDTPNHFLQ